MRYKEKQMAGQRLQNLRTFYLKLCGMMKNNTKGQ